MTPAMQARINAAVLEFAHDFVTASQNRRLHAQSSDFVQDSLRDMVRALERCNASGVDMPLKLQLSEHAIHFEGEELTGPSLQAGHLLRQCRERDIAQISFRPGLSAAEVNRCFDLLLLDNNRDALRRSRRDITLCAFGIKNVAFTLGTPADPGDRRAEMPADDEALQQYQNLAECLQQNHMLAYRDLELAIDEAAGLVEETLHVLDEPSSLLALATQDDVDRFTVGHSVRVALLALQVARQLGLGREQLVGIGTAALMHDIGKSKVPQEILWKNGKLDQEEWRLMAQHPRLGAELLLEQHASIDPCTIGAAFCHHMSPGGGYPQAALPIRLSGVSHLIRVCDVFEALTSVRPYKKALIPVEAYAVMFRHESDFHPDWLRAFVRSIGLFPTGTRLVLDDGSEGAVIAQSGDPSRPIVRLLVGPGDTPLAADQPNRIVIGTMVEGEVRRVAAVSTHERCVIIPEFDEGDAVLTTPHACLSPELIEDANRTARESAKSRETMARPGR
ncbi:MAG: HD domain-containing protein [Planctomycetes bacterium]|nr:HD domain-containing protein [Planctomycetota bacterium]